MSSEGSVTSHQSTQASDCEPVRALIMAGNDSEPVQTEVYLESDERPSDPPITRSVSGTQSPPQRIQRLTSTARGHILDVNQPRGEDEDFSIDWAKLRSTVKRRVRRVRECLLYDDVDDRADLSAMIEKYGPAEINLLRPKDDTGMLTSDYVETTLGHFTAVSYS